MQGRQAAQGLAQAHLLPLPRPTRQAQKEGAEWNRAQAARPGCKCHRNLASIDGKELVKTVRWLAAAELDDSAVQVAVKSDSCEGADSDT